MSAKNSPLIYQNTRWILFEEKKTSEKNHSNIYRQWWITSCLNSWVCCCDRKGYGWVCLCSLTYYTVKPLYSGHLSDWWEVATLDRGAAKLCTVRGWPRWAGARFSPGVSTRAGLTVYDEKLQFGIKVELKASGFLTIHVLVCRTKGDLVKIGKYSLACWTRWTKKFVQITLNVSLMSLQV